MEVEQESVINNSAKSSQEVKHYEWVEVLGVGIADTSSPILVRAVSVESEVQKPDRRGPRDELNKRKLRQWEFQERRGER